MNCLGLLRKLKQTGFGTYDGVVSNIGGQTCIRHSASVAPNFTPNYDGQRSILGIHDDSDPKMCSL